MTPLSPLDDLLTVAQIAQKYHLRDSTIRTYIKKGLLPAQKTPGGKNWLIRERDAAAQLSVQPSTGDRPMPLPAIPVSDSRIPNPNSPLIDRLGTPEGRARAIAIIQQLGEDRDEAEQRDSGALLRQAMAENRVQIRRWNPETGERLEGAE